MSSKIMLVGEAWGEQEAEEGRPFVGPSGRLLYSLMRIAGIDKDDVYLTNVFNRRPSQGSNDLAGLCGPKETALGGWPALSSGKYVRAEFLPELERLALEIKREQPNVIIAAGATAAWALCGITGIKKVRGAPLTTMGQMALRAGSFKVMPTYHPAGVLREWKLRPILIADLQKAKREAEYPEIRRPQREFWIEPNLEDLLLFEQKYFHKDVLLSTDIETSTGQITCIGFAPNSSVALVVPFIDPQQKDGNYWRTFREEIEAWRIVKRWCETYPTVFQNGMYDMNYLWKVYGIKCLKMKHDTMLLHHALQPEMEKGLGFLGSVYTDEPAWKFMRAKHETLKKED